MNRWTTLLTLLIPLCLGLATVGVLAQPYPNRPIKLIVGGAPGSVPDTMVRPVAERLSAVLGQSVVVDNRPGAAGIIAMDAMSRSAPDGYTLALATMSQAVFNCYLFSKLPYDPLRDLEPVATLVTGAMALAAHPSFQARSLQEFVALAKAQPGKLFVAMPQAGSPPHVVALLLNRAAGIDVTMVPHKSGTDAITAVLSGEIRLIIDAPTIISSHVQAGKLRALAVTGRQREDALPDVPTARESGFPAVEGEAWIGLVAPTGTPVAVVQRLNREIGTILATSEMQGLMAKFSFRPLTSTPEEFRKLIREDHAKWSTVIRDAGLKLD
ncbi:MAG: tripartite tricarboxylate transporter substrate binding protein [Betaproteobacteria bacterium]|nr:tripartite tricarboxylate transporter substrate binding protein [Betaproteobacteria bacterium]